MFRLSLPVTLFALACCCNLGCSLPRFSASRDFQASFPVSGPVSIRAMTSNGSITVVAYEGSSVELVAHLTARGTTQAEADDFLTQIDPVCMLENDLLTIDAKPKNIRFSTSISLELKVPSQSSVNLNTSNGEIVVSNTGGPVKAKTSNGDVSISQASAMVDAETSNGSLTFKECTCMINASTSNGNVTVEKSELSGKSSIRTSNGSMDLQLRSPAPLDLEASTSNGSIQCDLPLVAAQQTKKSIVGVLFPSEGNKPEGSLSLSTSNGSVHLKAE